MDESTADESIEDETRCYLERSSGKVIVTIVLPSIYTVNEDTVQLTSYTPVSGIGPSHWEKIAKNWGKEGENQEKEEKFGKGKGLLLCPPPRQIGLATPLTPVPLIQSVENCGLCMYPGGGPLTYNGATHAR